MPEIGQNAIFSAFPASFPAGSLRFPHLRCFVFCSLAAPPRPASFPAAHLPRRRGMIHSTSFRGRAPPVDLLALLIGAGPLSSGAPLWGNADERGQLISSPGTHVAGEETKYFPRHCGSAPMARHVVTWEVPGRADQEKRTNQVRAGLDSARLASFFPGLARCTSSLERNRADFPGHLYGGVCLLTP